MESCKVTTENIGGVASQLRNLVWERGSYFISTKPDMIPIDKLSRAFAQKELYWAHPLPEQAMKEMIDNSLCFGLYKNKAPAPIEMHANTGEGLDGVASQQQTGTADFIGIARCVTDFVTIAYLTDVWVEPSEQGNGLGSWLIQCAQGVLEEMPHLRRSMLITSDWDKLVPFYKKLMNMEVMECQPGRGMAVLGAKGKGHSSGVAANAASATASMKNAV